MKNSRNTERTSVDDGSLNFKASHITYMTIHLYT